MSQRDTGLGEGDARAQMVEAVLRVMQEKRFSSNLIEKADAVADVALAVVIHTLEKGYHVQNPSLMHPADFVTLAFKCDGYDGLRDIRRDG